MKNRKKYILLFVSVIASQFFTSCDDDSIDTDNSPIPYEAIGGYANSDEIASGNLVAKLSFEDALSDNKNAAMCARSSAFPMRFSGWRCALASRFCSLFTSDAANGVSVNEGAMQFTLILGAYSAAKAFVNPSIAPFEAETCE